MGIGSFRLRITLLSTFLSGIVLVAFGYWAWALMYQAGMDRIDQQLESLGQRHAGYAPHPEQWNEVESALNYFFNDRQDAWILLVTDREQDNVLYRSKHWPDEFSSESFQDIEGAFIFMEPPLEGPPGRPDGRRGPRGGRAGPPLAGQGFRGDRQSNEGFGGPGAPPPRPPERRFPGPPRTRFEDDPNRPPQGPPREQWGRREPGYDASGRTNGPPNGPPGGRFGRPGPPPRRGGREHPHPLATAEFETRDAGGDRWRLGVMGDRVNMYVLGQDLRDFDAEMAQTRLAFLGALGIACMLIALGGSLIAKRALRPVETLTATAEGMTAKGLDQRIPKTQEDREFTQLIGVFNAMMERLEKSFHQATRFSADAAHELKTPLTILQGELEQAMQRAEIGSDEQQVYTSLLDEVTRLKSIIRKLLLLSRADAGQLRIKGKPVNVSSIVEGLAEDIEILAPTLKLEMQFQPELWVQGDSDLLRQVLHNLTNNAIKYNRPDGLIRMYLRGDDKQVRFSIANTGKTIKEADRDRVFERFYRTDSSRNRKVGGAGLGLSIAREIARAHRGDLTLGKNADGMVSFTVTFPATTCSTR